MVMEQFDSGSPSELVTSVGIYGTSGSAVEKKVYSHTLTNVKAGDILIVFSEGEVTNSFTYNVGCWHYLKLSDGTKLTRVNGQNVVPADHHFTFKKFASFTFPQDFDTVDVEHWFYAASTGQNGSPQLVVEQGYGNINGVLHRMSV